VAAKKPRPRLEWERGESVQIIDGPFAERTGPIEDIMVDTQKVRVLVDIFGRETPVELNFNQIAKL
jgi:transcriptional antiterminator NusG